MHSWHQRFQIVENICVMMHKKFNDTIRYEFSRKLLGFKWICTPNDIFWRNKGFIIDIWVSTKRMKSQSEELRTEEVWLNGPQWDIQRKNHTYTGFVSFQNVNLMIKMNLFSCVRTWYLIFRRMASYKNLSWELRSDIFRFSLNDCFFDKIYKLLRGENRWNMQNKSPTRENFFDTSKYYQFDC